MKTHVDNQLDVLLHLSLIMESDAEISHSEACVENSKIASRLQKFTKINEFPIVSI